MKVCLRYKKKRQKHRGMLPRSNNQSGFEKCQEDKLCKKILPDKGNSKTKQNKLYYKKEVGGNQDNL